MKKLIAMALSVVLVLSLGLVSAATVSADPGPGIVGLWHFDEGSGVVTVADSSGNAFDGTVYGATTGEPGKFGNALSFDGSGDYVDCGIAVDNTITTGVTLEAWIKPALKQNGGIISNDYTLGNKKGYDFFLWAAHDTYGRLYIDFGSGSAVGRTWWAIPSSDWYDQWHHVAATWDGSDIRLYVDGSQVATVAFGGTYSDPGKATLIGGINYGTLPYCSFNGLIDEVRIWNEALSGTEIAYSYSLGDVGIDIKPGSDPNSINIDSNGVVPVAILGSDTFDAATVDPLTVELAGAEVRLKGKSGNAGSLEDVNGDGYLDLVVQVYTNELQVTGDGEVFLTAYTYAGLPIVGSDSVRIVPPE